MDEDIVHSFGDKGSRVWHPSRSVAIATAMDRHCVSRPTRMSSLGKANAWDSSVSICHGLWEVSGTMHCTRGPAWLNLWCSSCTQSAMLVCYVWTRELLKASTQETPLKTASSRTVQDENVNRQFVNTEQSEAKMNYDPCIFSKEAYIPSGADLSLLPLPEHWPLPVW